MHRLSGRRPTCAGKAMLILFGAAAVAYAGRPVTLQEAERLALERNPRIVIARDSLRASRANAVRARATLLPSISLSGGYTRNVERPVFFLPPFMSGGTGTSQPIEIGEKNEYQFVLNGTQPLFLGLAGITSYRMAQVQVRAAELKLEQTTQEVLQNVREAYLGAVLARKLVAVQEEAVAQAESSLALVRRRYEVGAASRFDLLRAQVQLATLTPRLVSARSRQALADAQLRLAIGLPPAEEIQPADTLHRFTSRWLDVSLDSLIRIAYENRPEVRQAGYLERIAHYGVRLARSGFFPTIFLFGRTMWQAQQPGLYPEDFVRSMSAGVQLSWTLWDSWKTPASVQQAKVGLRQVRQVDRLVRDGIAMEVEATYRQLHEAAATLASGEQTVAQAEEALHLARVMYESGGSTQLDVMNAELALTQAQVQYAQALYSYAVAHTKMEKALGVLRIQESSR